MAVCKKVLLVWCLVIAQSCALRIEREAEEVAAAPKTEKIAEDNEVDKRRIPSYGGHHNSHGDGSHFLMSNSMSNDEDYSVPPQRKCPQYYSCMNKLDELQDTMKSLKSERAVMMGTLKTIINKAKDSQTNIDKLTKKQKHLVHHYSKYEKIIKPNDVKIARNVRRIDALEDRKDKLEELINKWRKMCVEPLEDVSEDDYTIDADNDYGIYLYYTNRDNQVTYFDAQERCRSFGMDLLTISSQGEYDYIESELDDINDSDTGMELSGWWIGLNTLAEENNLRWLSTGSTANNAFTYEGAWQEDEPDYGDAQQYRAINWYNYDGEFAWSAEHYLDTSCFVCKAPEMCNDIALFDEWVDSQDQGRADIK